MTVLLRQVLSVSTNAAIGCLAKDDRRESRNKGRSFCFRYAIFQYPAIEKAIRDAADHWVALFYAADGEGKCGLA